MALYNKYKNEHYSENGTFWKLEILDSTLSSGNQDIDFDIGPEGVTVKWDGENDERYQPIKGSSCNFTMMITNATLNGFLALLRTADEGRFTIKLSYYDGSSWNVYWRGFIVAENLAEEDLDYPFELDVEAIDGLGRLKDLPFNHVATYNAGTGYKALAYITDMLALCGYIADFGTGNTFLTTIVDLYEDSMSNIGVQSSDPVEKTQIYADAFLQIDEQGVESPVSALDVLENICKIFGARIYQSRGSWYFVQIQRYHTTGTVEYRRYDEADNALGNGTLDLNKVGGSGNVIALDSSNIIKLAGMRKEFYEPLFRAAITYDTFGQTSLLKVTPSNQFSGATASNHVLGGLTANANDSIEVSWWVTTDVVTNSFNYSTAMNGFSGAFMITQYVGVQLYNDHTTNEYWDDTNQVWDSSGTPVTNYFPVQSLGQGVVSGTNFAYPQTTSFSFVTAELPRSAIYSIKFSAGPWAVGGGAYQTPPNGAGQVSASSTASVAAQAPHPVTAFLSPSKNYGRYVLYTEAGQSIVKQDYFSQVSNGASLEYQDESLLGDGPTNASVGRLEVWNGAAYVVADTWQQSQAGTSATLLTLIAELILGGQRVFVDKNQMTIYIKGGYAYLPDFTNSLKITEDSTDFRYIPNGIELKTGLDEISGEWFKSVLDTSSTTNTTTPHYVTTTTKKPNKNAKFK